MMTNLTEWHGRRIAFALLSLCSAALSACRLDRFERPEASYLGGGDAIAITREPTAAPPRLLVGVELDVSVASGQSLFEQGASGRWLDEENGETVEVDFGEPASSALTLVSTLGALPCDAGPWALEFEPVPRGEWSSDVAFPIDYQALVSLELERRDRLALESDLEVRLEVLP